MQCKEMTTAEVCYNDGSTLQTLIAHYEYGTNAAGNTIIVATRYTDSDGTPVDTSGGTVTAGACAVAAPDVEWEKLCDVQTGGSVIEFFCRTITSFDANGDVIDPVAVDNFELDKVTAYTPTGTVGACNEDCDAVTAQGVLTTWG